LPEPKLDKKNIRVPPLIFSKNIFFEFWDKICSFSQFEGIFEWFFHKST
jgi:hypothetical protein